LLVPSYIEILPDIHTPPKNRETALATTQRNCNDTNSLNPGFLFSDSKLRLFYWFKKSVVRRFSEIDVIDGNRVFVDHCDGVDLKNEGMT